MAGPVSRELAPLLVCVGDLLEDVVVWTRGPARGATDNPSDITRTRGGSAANVAMFASTQVSTRFIGRVGDDALGRSLVAQLAAAGVDVRAQYVGRTGSIVILVDEHGERTMYPDRGTAGDLADIPAEWVDGAGVLHAPAYCFASATSRTATIGLLTRARKNGAAISVDAASVSVLSELGVDRFLGIARSLRASVLFANAAEAELLATGRVRLDGTTVVVKDGPRPVVVRRPDGRTRIVPVPSVPVVRDTTGAGDAFAAGYLAALLGGSDEVAAVRNGSALATSVLTEPGATVRPAGGRSE